MCYIFILEKVKIKKALTLSPPPLQHLNFPSRDRDVVNPCPVFRKSRLWHQARSYPITGLTCRNHWMDSTWQLCVLRKTEEETDGKCSVVPGAWLEWIYLHLPSSLLRQLMWLLQSSPGSPKSLGGQQAHHESNPLPRKVNLNLILNHWRFDVFCGFIQLRQTLAISPPNFYRWGNCGPREKAAFVGAAS